MTMPATALAAIAPVLSLLVGSRAGKTIPASQQHTRQQLST